MNFFSSKFFFLNRDFTQMGDLYFASVDSVFLFVNAEVFLSQGLSGKRKITNESSFVHYCGAFVSL